MSEYVHEVYGTTEALVRNPDGSSREATPDELEQLRDRYKSALESSFRTRIASEFKCRLDLIAADVLNGAGK